MLQPDLNKNGLSQNGYGTYFDGVHGSRGFHGAHGVRGVHGIWCNNGIRCTLSSSSTDVSAHGPWASSATMVFGATEGFFPVASKDRTTSCKILARISHQS